MSRPSTLALVGPTASGKSALAHRVALACGDLEIVSVDSMQVYRGMDVGTAKPTPAQQAEVPYHLLDVVEPSDDFDVARFTRLVRAAVADIHRRGRRALLVGGTGLYHRAVIDDLDLPGRYPAHRAEIEAETDTRGLHRRLAELDPVAAGRIEPANRRRIVRALEVTLGSGRPFSSYGPGLDHYPPSAVPQVGLWWTRAQLRRRIAERLDRMAAGGLLDEVRRLHNGPLSRTAAQALGYRELLEHLDGRTPLEDALAAALSRTRRFARRQRMWFRRDPRVRWIAAGADAAPPVSLILTVADPSPTNGSTP